jgi:hypothetical protein
MKLLQANITCYSLLINCGQLGSNQQLHKRIPIQCPDQELIDSLSKDTALHFTSKVRARTKHNPEREGDCHLLG